MEIQPFVLVVGARCTNEYLNSPTYGMIEITNQMVSRIQGLQEIVKAHNLVSVRVWYTIDWHQADDLMIQGDSMVVYENSFFFAAWPRFGGGEYETIAIDMDVLMRMVEAVRRGRASEHDPFVVKGGVVFYDDGNSDYLVELYEEEAVGGDDPEDPALTATPCA